MIRRALQAFKADGKQELKLDSKVDVKQTIVASVSTLSLQASTATPRGGQHAPSRRSRRRESMTIEINDTETEDTSTSVQMTTSNNFHLGGPF